jgi:hypothetical protein
VQTGRIDPAIIAAIGIASTMGVDPKFIKRSVKIKTEV